MTITDGLVLLGSILGIGGLVAGGEGLRRRGVSTAATRRLVHAGVALFVVATPWLFSGPGPLYVLAGSFVVINGTARALSWWPSLHAARPASWGTVALPAAVVPALAATWSVAPERIPHFQVAFLVIGGADPLAAWVGQRYGTTPLTASATRVGAGTFAGVTAVLVALFLMGVGHPAPRLLAAAGLTALVATGTEAISGNGWDNLTVVGAVLLVLVPLSEGIVSPAEMAGALLLGAGFGGLAWRVGVLDGPGATAGGLFAASLVGLGGPAWILPGVAFFALSSALSGLPAGEASEAMSTAQRTLRQVLANGGVAWGLLMIHALAPLEASRLRTGCYLGFLGALAAAAADTWATEIGTRYAGQPVSVLGGGRMPKGTSGAVSGIGTGAALLGAGSVAVAGRIVATGPTGTVPVASVVAAGLVGMILDSFVGATLQARYATGEGASAERPSRPGEQPVRGWARIDNDVVNVLGTVGGAGAALLFWMA
jgi:uncharacterized protein (TIGR00297 family)